jgi:hypothetical protein
VNIRGFGAGGVVGLSTDLSSDLLSDLSGFGVFLSGLGGIIKTSGFCDENLTDFGGDLTTLLVVRIES